MMKQEYIGKSIEVLSSPNNTLIGKKGKILDETKESFVISNGKTIRILKRNNLFKINDKKIDGSMIAKRPEERIKIKNG